jgi:hypothetical protein
LETKQFSFEDHPFLTETWVLQVEVTPAVVPFPPTTRQFYSSDYSNSSEIRLNEGQGWSGPDILFELFRGMFLFSVEF